MDFEPKTIAEQINCLAKMTGATAPFVNQVRQLFSSKGISLDADATPYIKALDEAFTREESIRANTQDAKAKVQAIRSKFDALGETYSRQLKQLRQAQSELRNQKTRGKSQVVIPGTHRTYVTRQQRESLPMVPGPEDLQ
ncbi:MAG: hypothetical protein OEV00_09865 [Acidobacteriota bacterium]|nr:hypothetical protein [Acidobacteriota bacterium]MDH3785617.1 hypothetical protein [Acidobacteriota bacterium]